MARGMMLTRGKGGEEEGEGEEVRKKGSGLGTCRINLSTRAYSSFPFLA